MGANPGDPSRGHNSHSRVDHIMATMSRVADDLSRETVAMIGMHALGHTPAEKDPKKIKGAVYFEVGSLHEEDGDENEHMAVILLNGNHVYNNTVFNRFRNKDLAVRGWRDQPEWEEVEKKNGKRTYTEKIPKEGTGTRWHLQIQAAHLWHAEDAEVKAGGPKAPQAGAKKWDQPWNDMVSYFQEPKSGKEIDSTPFYINCTKDTIWEEDLMADSMLESVPPLALPKNVAELVRYAADLKRVGIPKVKALEYIGQRIGKSNNWMWNPATQAFNAAKPMLKVGFLPKGMEEGAIIPGIKKAQLEILRWIEGSGLKDCQFLWIQAESGFGKTTVFKLIVVRYPDNVYIARKRASKGVYDDTAVLDYEDEKIILFNDLVPEEKGNFGAFKWPWCTIQLLKTICDGYPVGMNYSHESMMKLINAKILVNSTHEPPTDGEFRRRCTWMVVRQIDGEPLLLEKGTEGSAEDGEWIVPRPGLQSADDFRAPWEANGPEPSRRVPPADSGDPPPRSDPDVMDHLPPPDQANEVNSPEMERDDNVPPPVDALDEATPLPKFHRFFTESTMHVLDPPWARGIEPKRAPSGNNSAAYADLVDEIECQHGGYVGWLVKEAVMTFQNLHTRTGDADVSCTAAEIAKAITGSDSHKFEDYIEDVSDLANLIQNTETALEESVFFFEVGREAVAAADCELLGERELGRYVRICTENEFHIYPGVAPPSTPWEIGKPPQRAPGGVNSVPYCDVVDKIEACYGYVTWLQLEARFHYYEIEGQVCPEFSIPAACEKVWESMSQGFGAAVKPHDLCHLAEHMELAVLTCPDFDHMGFRRSTSDDAAYCLGGDPGDDDGDDDHNDTDDGNEDDYNDYEDDRDYHEHKSTDGENSDGNGSSTVPASETALAEEGLGWKRMTRTSTGWVITDKPLPAGSVPVVPAFPLFIRNTDENRGQPPVGSASVIPVRVVVTDTDGDHAPSPISVSSAGAEFVLPGMKQRRRILPPSFSVATEAAVKQPRRSLSSSSDLSSPVMNEISRALERFELGSGDADASMDVVSQASTNPIDRLATVMDTWPQAFLDAHVEGTPTDVEATPGETISQTNPLFSGFGADMPGGHGQTPNGSQASSMGEALQQALLQTGVEAPPLEETAFDTEDVPMLLLLPLEDTPVGTGNVPVLPLEDSA
jgi:hypothetical protein